jgi:hypothetical protein
MYFVQILNQTSLVAGLISSIAFVLTLWPSQCRVKAAAVLYGVGIFMTMGVLAYYFGRLVWMMYGLSDSGRANPIALVGLICPIWAIGYAGSATAFLWPSISQKKALRCGKVVHLAIGLPLALWMGIHPASPHASAFGVGWLVYALLWFRIRENYPAFLDNQKAGDSKAHNLEPAQ